MITAEWRAHAKAPGDFPDSLRGAPRLTRREVHHATKHDLFYWLYAVRLPAVLDADIDTYPRAVLLGWAEQWLVAGSSHGTMAMEEGREH